MKKTQNCLLETVMRLAEGGDRRLVRFGVDGTGAGGRGVGWLGGGGVGRPSSAKMISESDEKDLELLT